MEPISICLGLLSAVKQGVAMYKEAKAVGYDATSNFPVATYSY